MDPRDHEKFPGIREILSGLKSWEWKYGWTPKFQIQKWFTFKHSQNIDTESHESRPRNTINIRENKDINYSRQISHVQIILECNKGVIDGVKLNSGDIKDIDQYSSVIEGVLKGVKFDPNQVDLKLLDRQSIGRTDGGLDFELLKWIISCIRNMTISAS